jgi:hypothetical protein
MEIGRWRGWRREEGFRGFSLRCLEALGSLEGLVGLGRFIDSLEQPLNFAEIKIIVNSVNGK